MEYKISSVGPIAQLSMTDVELQLQVEYQIQVQLDHYLSHIRGQLQIQLDKQIGFPVWQQVVDQLYRPLFDRFPNAILKHL